MEASYLLESLNEPQRRAVSAPLGNVLVLAGAGSGKTRVLVHRIAWLIEVENISPFAILAVTFTNKAANEMRGRIESLLSMPTRGMWVGTFHGLAHRILRMHWEEAGLTENFQILDSDDQYRLIRRILKNLGLDEAHWPPRKVQWFINGNKDEGLRSHHIRHQEDLHLKTMLKIYKAYEEACDRGSLVDFAELLLRAHELWLNNPEILKHYQERFRYVLVDEFQDTNKIQYAWVRLLAGENSYMMIVGDDDQSIYGWRGACVENLQRFSRDYSDCDTIRLEQNYRSTNTILKAANALIEHNEGRLGKNLWTEGDDGEPISVYAAYNEIDEARYIVGRIEEWVAQGHSPQEAAILYRSNAQSRVIEEALLTVNMPYRVYGGFRFFERTEVKDVLAYVRLVLNRNDDAAFERIVNKPTRGIGNVTLENLREIARSQQITLWQATTNIIAEKSLAIRASNALVGFLKLIDDMGNAIQGIELEEQIEHVLHASGLWQFYSDSKGEKAQTQVENLQELVVAAKQFNPNEFEEELPPLSLFLSHAALEAGDAQGDATQECVQLMTLHAAKGLEFPLVIMGGVEEGLFPHAMSAEEPGRLAEERRLCYVGMTRAMKKLYITYAELRRQYGNEQYHRPSRFIAEIPAELIQAVRMKTKSTSVQHVMPKKLGRKHNQEQIEDTPFQLGQAVRHAKFGEGVILNYEGSGSHARVQVNFAEQGCKWLVLAYANLESSARAAN